MCGFIEKLFKIDKFGSATMISMIVFFMPNCNIDLCKLMMP